MALGTDRDSIRKEAEEAEAELEKIRLENEQKEAERLAKEKEPLTATSIEDIFSSSVETTAPASGIDVGAQGKTETPAATGDAALLAENAQLKTDLQKLQARFESTFGNFNKTGMAELQKQLDEVKAELAEAKKKPAAPVLPAIPEIDHANLVDDYGEGGAKLYELNLSLQQKIDSLESTLNDVTGQVKATSEKAGHLEAGQTAIATRSYYAALDSLCPEWRKINGDDKTPQDPKYTAFLDKPIPGTDMTYDDAIKAYHERGNAVKVAEIFNLFKASEGAAPAASDGGKDELIPEPGKTGGGSPPPKPKTEKRTYTRAEIDRFDALKKAGKLKATPAQIDAVENDIQDAILEGRVRG